MEELSTAYGSRNIRRLVTWETATEALIAHFIGLGDTEDEAEDKVKLLGTEIADNHTPAFLKYWWGVSTQPLIDVIDNTTLVDMTAAAKTVVTDILKQN